MGSVAESVCGIGIARMQNGIQAGHAGIGDGKSPNQENRKVAYMLLLKSAGHCARLNGLRR